MKQLLFIFALLLSGLIVEAQTKTIAQIKDELEKSTNAPLYVKDVLKKKFAIDTITVPRIGHFQGLPDSLAYYGKKGKVYGPYAKGKVLVQVLAKAPNTFNRVGQIFLDTSVLKRRIADSLANSILARVRSGSTTFEDMAQTYSMGGESVTKGDLGWIAAGAMIPQIDAELAKHKKGDIFKVWTRNGIHIIRKTDSKEDTGFAMIMRIFL